MAKKKNGKITVGGHSNKNIRLKKKNMHLNQSYYQVVFENKTFIFWPFANPCFLMCFTIPE